MSATSTTRVDEVADGIYRISTPVRIPGGGFSFNQYLLRDEEPLLFHTGPRALRADVLAAIGRVLPVERVRHVAFSHVESDEMGGLDALLAAAPQAAPLCGNIAKLISVDDLAARPARGLGDGERLALGARVVRWIDAPHLPHAWECGYLFEETTRTLLCGDLFTQPGDDHPPVTEGDILGPSEAMRARLDYFSHTRHAPALIEKLAATAPTTLACMHGAAWRGDGAALLRQLGAALAGD